MAKTLKQMLEVYKPKAADEQKFVDKHVVAKHADANGNADDVFQGTNVKKIERKKERHGYDAGDDEKVYEEKSDNAGKFIKGFEKSDAPQFQGKSKAKRRDMAIAAYLGNKKGMKEEVVVEEEGSIPKTPREKELAAKHGDKTRITHGDVLKARGVTMKKEETVGEIRERYMQFNKHAVSYTWKALIDGEFKNLNLEQTLERNSVPDETDEYAKLGLDDDFYIPTIHIYFDDDLTYA